MKNHAKEANMKSFLMKNSLYGMGLGSLFVALFLFWGWHKMALDQWLSWLVCFVVLIAASIFEARWISKQPDQLMACYRAANISMWFFLLLAIVSAVPNFFIAADLDKTVLWPVLLVSMARFATAIFQRQELLGELAERKKSHSMGDVEEVDHGIPRLDEGVG